MNRSKVLIVCSSILLLLFVTARRVLAQSQSLKINKLYYSQHTHSYSYAIFSGDGVATLARSRYSPEEFANVKRVKIPFKLQEESIVFDATTYPYKVVPVKGTLHRDGSLTITYRHEGREILMTYRLYRN